MPYSESHAPQRSVFPALDRSCNHEDSGISARRRARMQDLTDADLTPVKKVLSLDSVSSSPPAMATDYEEDFTFIAHAQGNCLPACPHCYELKDRFQPSVSSF